MFRPNGIGDLFDMLLPMLSIYQEYVRNHHFSLQVLAECKQREKFASMLRRLEEKPVTQGKCGGVWWVMCGKNKWAREKREGENSP